MLPLIIIVMINNIVIFKISKIILHASILLDYFYRLILHFWIISVVYAVYFYYFCFNFYHDDFYNLN